MRAPFGECASAPFRCDAPSASAHRIALQSTGQQQQQQQPHATHEQRQQSPQQQEQQQPPVPQ